jgi:hypothetical protein
MEENIRWVWYAFGAAWGIHLVYVASLSVRQNRLLDQIRDLKTLLEQRGREQSR